MTLPRLDFSLSLPGDFSLTPELTLPADTEGHRIGVLGTSGAGKTSVAKVIVEKLVEAGRRVCILDPAGVWWGLKVSSDGQGPGLPVVVFGGRRADVPLDLSAGAAVADFAVDQGVATILDLSGFEDDADLLKVAADFVRRLRYRQGEGGHDPVLLVADEADLLAPQTARKGAEQACQSALRGVARRGRSDGLGLMTITQRPVGLHTDIVSMAEASVLMRFTGDNDLTRIKDWLGSAFGKAQIDAVLSALPQLADGEAFAASPGWLKTLTRTQFPRPQTFDSSAAPKAGQRPPSAVARADVDMTLLAARFAKAIQEEQESDPAALKLRIDDLERQLRAKPAGSSVEKIVEKTVEKRVEVPVFREGEVARLSALSDDMIALGKDLLAGGQEIRAKIKPQHIGEPEDVQAGPVLEKEAKPAPSPKVVVPLVNSPASPAVSSSRQSILDTLARLAATGLHKPLREHVAVFAGVSPSSSGYGNNLGALRTAGLVDYPAPGRLCLTPAGRSQARPAKAPLTRKALHTAWLSRLPAPQQRILSALIGSYPRALKRTDLARTTGVSATSSGYGNNLGKLRSLGLVDYPGVGTVAATNMLFPEGLPE